MPSSDRDAGDAAEGFAAFAEQREVVFGVAYRMLGNVAEAEDIVQECYLRWRTQEPTTITSAKAWLVATATRLCIDRVRSAQRRREEYVGVWLPEPLVGSELTTSRDAAILADSLSMAFMVMLDSLAPIERAVFLLREAFDHDYAEIAGIVGRSEAACRQIVSRAKRQLAQSPRAETPAGPKAEKLVQRFLSASRTGGLADLLAMLTDDVVLYTDGGGQVSAAGRPILGADRVGRFFVGIRRFASPEMEARLAQVNGRPGAIVLQDGKVDRVISLEFDGDRVRAIYIVRNPKKLTRVL